MQEKDPLWDQEFFLRQMDNLRGWKTERALAEWARIKAVGGERDEGGPAHSKERLAIPSNLVGMASVNKDQGFGEQKTVSTGSKLGRMSEQMQATLRGEMAKGFDQNSVGNASVIGLDVTMALPSGALTSAVASEDRDFIADMVSKVATPAPSDSERTDGGSGGDSMPGHNKTRAKPALVDLPLLRFKSRASETNLVDKTISKMTVDVKKAGEALDSANLFMAQDHDGVFALAESRWQACMLFLGLQPELKGERLGVDYTKEGTKIDYVRAAKVIKREGMRPQDAHGSVAAAVVAPSLESAPAALPPADGMPSSGKLAPTRGYDSVYQAN